MSNPTPAILAALKRCPHCPFLVKWSEFGEGIIRDATFTPESVDRWITSDPWPCHQYPDEKTACCGQKMFLAGALDVSREELVSIWVNERDPSDLIATHNT